MTPGQDAKTLASILSLAIDFNRPTFPAMVGRLSEWGDVEGLRAILEHKVVDPNDWKNDEKVRRSILKVVETCKPDEREHAESLISDWGKAFGVVDASEMLLAIAESRDALLVKSLVARGISPVTFDDVGETPLKSAIDNARQDVVHFFVRHCLQHDVIPMLRNADTEHPHGWSLFEHLTTKSNASVDTWLLRSALDVVEEVGLGQSCKSRAQEALLRAKRSASFEPRIPSTSSQSDLVYRLAAMAGFNREQWEQFLNIGDVPGCVAAGLTVAPESTAIAVVLAMHAAGVDVDAPIAAGLDPGSRMTLLQIAALAERPALVQGLLDLGADPMASVNVKGQLTCAYDLAPDASVAKMTLSAWRARTSMRSTLPRPVGSQ